MLHKTLEAKATTTDLGEFTALAATYSVDRTSERIVPGAFKGTIAKWQESGKQLPLHWDHMGEAQNIIGTVDPSSMAETEDGLRVKGKLDLEDSDVARNAWRLMKKDAVALSFGYLVLDEGKGSDNIRELKSIDLFEITITPAPVNPDTRFLDLKSMKEMTPAEMALSLREVADGVSEKSAAMALRTMADDLAALDRDAERRALRQESLKRAREATSDGVRVPELSDEQKRVFLDPDAILLAPRVTIEGTELKGAQEGDLKAVWTAAYVNDLPDSAFLYVESGGEKDEEGKTTPRNLRHFPVKDSSGAVDLPHLRNALARIPQSNLPQDVKDRLTAKAQQMLDSAKAIGSASDVETVTGMATDRTQDLTPRAIQGVNPEEPQQAKARTRDPLRQSSLDVAREARVDGLVKVELPGPEPQPEEAPSVRELRRRSRQAMLDALRG